MSIPAMSCPKCHGPADLPPDGPNCLECRRRERRELMASIRRRIDEIDWDALTPEQNAEYASRFNELLVKLLDAHRETAARPEPRRFQA